MNVGRAAVVASIGLGLVIGTGTADATTVKLSPTRDATIYEPFNSNGGGQYLFSGTSLSMLKRRTLITFGVAQSIPEGSTITSVALTLFVSRAQLVASMVSLHPLFVNWGEGPSVATFAEGNGTTTVTGDSSWEHRIFLPFLPFSWTNPGADGDYAAASASLAVPAQLVNEIGFPGFFQTWSSSAMADDVQLWLDDPSANFGWIVIGSNTVQSAKRFNSRENIDTGSRPSLLVTYEVPEPEASWAGFAALAALAVLRREQCRSRGQHRAR